MKPVTTKQQTEAFSLFQQGQRAIQLGAFEQAELLLTKSLRINPNLLEARAFLAYVLTATKQYAKATQELRLLLKTGHNLAQTHHNLGNSLFEQKLYSEAIEHYLSAIKLDASRVDTHIHCGITYRMMGKHEHAIEHLHQALNLDKKNARAFHVLGMIYVDITDFPRALECLENAAGLAPTEPQYHVSFAETLKKAGLDYEAGIELHRACEINPNYADSFIGYGQYLLEHHRHDEAMECFEHAKSLAPTNLYIQERLGDTFAGLGNIEKAITIYDSVLLSEPDRINALLGKGQVYIDTGKSKEVNIIANQIIALDPVKPHGYLLKSRSEKSKVGDGLAQQLIGIADDNQLDKDTQIAIHFALGKIFDDQNNYAQAFKHYAEGNELKNERFSYTTDADNERFSTLIDYFDADFFDTYKHLGADSDMPIIIIGMPRSSTTLTEQIISSHPQVLAAGEVVFWTKSPTALPLRLGSHLDYPACVSNMLPEQAKEVAATYETTLKKIAGTNTNAKHITDKMPHNFLHLGLIALLFPKAKIIHTKRNPIDTCLSIFFQNFNDAHPYAFDLKNLGYHYKQYERIMDHWHEVLPGRIMDIQYEDTISDPEYWSRKLIEYIGLEWDDACLAPHKLERTVKTASHWQVRQPIYKTSVQRWKNYEPFLSDLINALKK